MIRSTKWTDIGFYQCYTADIVQNKTVWLDVVEMKNYAESCQFAGDSGGYSLKTCYDKYGLPIELTLLDGNYS